MKHYFNEGKEYLKKDDKFDYQGKSRKQYEDSAFITFIGFSGIVVVLVIAKIFNM